MPPGDVGAVMTVHKLSAGSGYTYLTRQVVSADEGRAGQQLADYYAATGNPPGEWCGGGAATLGVAGTDVSEAQMRALFGEGRHPDRDGMLAAGLPEATTRLGTPYRGGAGPTDAEVVARVARFTAEAGRAPSAVELRRIVAEQARRLRRPVAGFDLVFTPVKSVSLLWALGTPAVRTAVEAAHHEAVAATVSWLDTHAAYTRSGRAGVAQIDTTGLVAAAFDHRESRAGDPDLHTHVAVANKVCGTDGVWRSLDARLLHSLGVAASERYNTRLEDAVSGRLGVRFEARSAGHGKRPVREVAGIPASLVRAFSRRRAAIEDCYTDLLAEYRAAHHRDPDRSTQLALAQQATLVTREPKGPPRQLSTQLAGWRSQAAELLGYDASVLIATVTGRPVPLNGLTQAGVSELARSVVATVSEQRSTWTVWNVYAEAERQLRPARFTGPAARDAATAAVVAAATSPGCSIRIDAPQLVADPPELCRASDGASVYSVHGADRFTSAATLAAEDLLVEAAQAPAQRVVDPRVAAAAVAVFERRHRVRLDDGQRALVAAFATTPAAVAVGIGPAGAGKTTAMRAFTAAWTAGGGRVVPLGTSAKAAQVLGSELGTRAENLHKFLHDTGHGPDWKPPAARDPWFALRPGDCVLLDEAGMAGTQTLAALVRRVQAAGAVVRLLGDPAQLTSVEAGGALGLLESVVGVSRLDHLHRFADPAEAAATTLLRRGDPAALGFYTDHGRIRSGSREAMAAAAFDGWAADMAAGHTTILVAASGADVTSLNSRARLERIAAGQVDPSGLELADGTKVGRGDWIVTRANARTLRTRRGGWVRNADTWTVTAVHRDGSLSVRGLNRRGRLRLPREYVQENVQLAYATTVHRSQGVTVDTAHPLVTPEMTREGLYVASTRARLSTTWYVATEELLDVCGDQEPDPPRTAGEVLAGVLSRVGAEPSATQTIRASYAEAGRLSTLVPRYEHSWAVAARASLDAAAGSVLPGPAAAALLADPAANRLAGALARAAGRGADPARVLAAAMELEPLVGASSVAAVLASRIEDYPTTLGVPRGTPTAPLPWLQAPQVGHPQWSAYLTGRADLIGARVDELGSLAAAYREHYGPQALPADSLGPPLPDGTTQHTAYLASRAEAARPRQAPTSRPAGPPLRRRTVPGPSPAARRPGLSRNGPTLSR